MITPAKVGDHVKVTLGESVVVGEVTARDIFRATVQADGDNHPRNFSFARWTFEVLAPVIPDTVGTWIKDCDGVAWRRDPSGWGVVGFSMRRTLKTVTGLYGPLVEVEMVAKA